jgi:oligopeptide transport system substrate-binding protein
MRRLRPGLVGCLVALVAWLPLAAPARGATAQGPVLNIDWRSEPPDLNPVTATDEVSFNVLNQVMQGLTQLGPDGRVEPGIAARWQVSPDGRTYTFYLRDARWSNGDPVVAEDFVYAWEQVLNPCNGSQYAYQMQYIVGAEALLDYTLPPKGCDASTERAIAHLEAHLGIRAPNPHTLVVTLVRPTPYWLGLTAFPTYFPLDAARVARWGIARYGQDLQHMVFDGPFVISAWVHDSYLDLRKNPLYWDAKHVYLAGVHGVMVSDAATEVNLYETGKLDVLTDIPATFIPYFSHQPGFHTFPLLTVWFVELNVQHTVFRNLDIRRAFSLAIDRQAFVAHVVHSGEPAYAYDPPTVDYAPGKPFLDLVAQRLPVTAEPAEARADLAAGLKALGLRRLPPITLLADNTTDGRLFAEALQAMWRQVLGVTVRLENVDFPTELALMQQGRFDMALSGWGADYDDPNTFLSLWTSTSSFNDIHWSDPAYDRAMALAAATTDLAVRGRYLAQAEDILLTQMPIIPLYWQARAWIAHPDVQGIVWELTGPDYSLAGVRKT